VIGYLWSVEGELPRTSRESGRVGARQKKECEMRDIESPLTMKAICFDGAIFEVFFIHEMNSMMRVIFKF